jgi:dsRNA-specific ribonuclease
MLSPIAEEYGFSRFISAIEGEFEVSKTSLQEDVFEAFIGATEFLIDTRIRMGAGYAIVYDILKSVDDSRPIGISYEELHSPISRLKEIFDRQDVQRGLDCDHTMKQKVKYETISPETLGTSLYRSTVSYHGQNGRSVIMADGFGSSKVSAENKAAIGALDFLRSKFGIHDDDKAIAYRL